MCTNNKKGLTVVEMLVVIVVMAVLISLLIPAVTTIREVAEKAKQRGEFVTISMGLESFRNDFGDYPNSYAGTDDYCGAQILAEAMVGYDLFGLHPKTNWKSNDPNNIYDTSENNLKARVGPYVEIEKVGAIALNDIGSREGLYSNAAGFSSNLSSRYVLTDTYKRNYTFDIDGDGKADIVKSGMPILYFKARSNKYKLDSNGTDSIYDFRDNQELVDSRVPWDDSKLSPLDTDIFYDTDSPPDTPEMKYITNPAAATTTATDKIPYNKDSFILISAGKDGLYGTNDDIFNFEKE